MRETASHSLPVKCQQWVWWDDDVDDCLEWVLWDVDAVAAAELGSETLKTCLKITEAYLLLDCRQFLQVVSRVLCHTVCEETQMMLSTRAVIDCSYAYSLCAWVFVILCRVVVAIPLMSVWQKYGDSLLSSVMSILSDVKDEGAVLVCRVSMCFSCHLFTYFQRVNSGSLFITQMTHDFTENWDCDVVMC